MPSPKHNGSAGTLHEESSTVSYTQEQVNKINALIKLMNEHYDPLPPQLESYLQLVASATSPASAEEKMDYKSQERGLMRDVTWLYCSAFLVSREWDVQKAFSMMQEVVVFRAENRLDEQSFFPPAVSVRGWSTTEVCKTLGKNPRETSQRADRVSAGVAQAYNSGIHYWDKAGRPVVYAMMNSLDERDLLRQLKKMANVGQTPVDVMWEFVLHFLSVLESILVYQFIQREVQRSQSPPTLAAVDSAVLESVVSQVAVTIIFDMKGLSMRMLWKPLIDVTRAINQKFFKYYPDKVHSIVCVNSPSLVRYAFRLLSGVMPAAFQKKIRFISPHDTPATLESLIDKKYIPYFLGGDCHCTAEKGECVRGYDPQHPRGTTGTNTSADSPLDDDDEEASTEDVTLSAGHEHTQVFHVKASEVVCWEYCVVGGGNDIRLTTFFVPQSVASGMQWAKVESKKLSSYKVETEALSSGSDALAATENGVVVLAWCNTRTWLASKHLQLRVYKKAAPSANNEQELSTA
ncbi:hypothetical protein JKF63_03933 [Porcisia hertigi]|uniref:CRAL-TRIO domain-containing protein n=1 Tax=Porcisia hertigi TaxID=2761500 RepID=A0A836HCP4_9TRYP|nr:hypothetical protein JKF63_03933 [Porcisia hertigi]